MRYKKAPYGRQKGVYLVEAEHLINLTNLYKTYDKRKLSWCGDRCDTLHNVYFNEPRRIAFESDACDRIGDLERFDHRADGFCIQGLRQKILRN